MTTLSKADALDLVLAVVDESDPLIAAAVSTLRDVDFSDPDKNAVVLCTMSLSDMQALAPNASPQALTLLARKACLDSKLGQMRSRSLRNLVTQKIKTKFAKKAS